MSTTEDSDDYGKSEKDEFIDWDNIKPYSSCWVSTRKESRSQKGRPGQLGVKASITPSKAHNDLHSLLKNLDNPRSTTDRENENIAQLQISTTKPDFIFDPYKLFDKSDTMPLKQIPDKIIESMCKHDGSPILEIRNASIKIDDSKQILFEDMVEGKTSDETLAGTNDSGEVSDNLKENNKIEGPNIKTYNEKEISNNIKNNEEIDGEKSDKQEEMERGTYLGAGEGSDKTYRIRQTDSNGRFIAEMDLTSLKIRDSSGRSYPVAIKYIWETDPVEIIKSSDKVFNPSEDFIKLINTLTSLINNKNNNTPIFNNSTEEVKEKIEPDIGKEVKSVGKKRAISVSDYELKGKEVNRPKSKKDSKLRTFRSGLLVAESLHDNKDFNRFTQTSKISLKKSDTLPESIDRKFAFNCKRQSEEFKVNGHQRGVFRKEPNQRQFTESNIRLRSKGPSAPKEQVPGKELMGLARTQRKLSQQDMDRQSFVKRTFGNRQNQAVATGRPVPGK